MGENHKIKEVRTMRKSDQELTALLQTYPDQAMKELIEQYTGLVWHIISGHLNQVEDIRECVNDTFAEFYFQRENFDPAKGTLAAYLGSIARNKAISKYRKNEQFNFHEPLEEEKLVDISDPMDHIEWKLVLEKAMEILSADELQLIRMKYYENMSVKEIADALNLPYETVKKRHQRGILKMRKSLLLLLIIIFVTLLTACAYFVLSHFGVVPGYGINTNEEADAYTLTATVSGENEFIHVLAEDAFLMDGELQIRLLLAHKSQETAAASDSSPDNLSFDYAGNRYPITMFSSVSLSEVTEECTIICTGLAMPEKETESIPIDFYWNDITLSFTLSKAAEESIDQYHSQLVDGRGLLAIPRLENGELITGIYPLNQGAYKILPSLNSWITDDFVTERASVTVTDSSGNVMNGIRMGYSPVSRDPYYDWNFGNAQAGTYTLHVPYVYAGSSLPEDFCIPLDLENGADPDSVYQIPGGTIQVTDYRKVKADEIPASKYTTVFYSDDSDYWLITLTASFEDADRYIIDLNLSPQIEFVPTEGSPTTCGISVVALPEPNTITLLLTLSGAQFDLSTTALLANQSLAFSQWNIITRWNPKLDISFTVD